MKRYKPSAVSVPIIAVLLYLPAVIAAVSANWTLFASPSPANTNFLYGIAAVSGSDVWAVGYDYKNSTRLQATLTEHWNGTTWSTVASPNPGISTNCAAGYSGNVLSSVAAVSTSDVWAVGYICGYQSKTLTEHWNGTKWTVISSPNESGAQTSTLVAVAAHATNDVWAVGNYQVSNQYQWDTLIEHWDGTKWSIVNSPNASGADKNFLNAVAAMSSNDVWTVGYTENTSGAGDFPLIEHYDGQNWTIVKSVYPSLSTYNALYAVAALASNDIWAVGYANENSQGRNGAALIEHWDGTSWTLSDSPVAGSATTLYSLAPISSTSIWAVGYIKTSDVQFLPVTEHWDGTSWSVVTPPDPGKVAQLFSAAAVNGNVWAVGAYSLSSMKQGYMPNPLTLTMKR
jgi:hypothetical protein